MKQPYSREAKIAKMVKGAMLRRNVSTQTELSAYSGIAQPTLSKKLAGAVDWTIRDFWKLDKALKFEPEEWYVLLEVARK